jgi:hypothetical protein
MNVYNKTFFCALVLSPKKVGASKVRVNKKFSSRNKYWKKYGLAQHSAASEKALNRK